MLAALWIFVAVALALWTLLGWGLYRLLVLDPGWVGDLGALMQSVPFGEVLDRWLPLWRELVGLTADLMQYALAQLGSVAPLVVGIVWGAGALLLLGGGGVLTLLVVLLRDKPPQSGAPRR